MTDLESRRAIEAVWRIESARLIGALTRLVRDVGVAEELAQEALVAALERWPQAGIPDNPGAWLMTTAKNRALDELRRRSLHARKHDELGHEAATEGDPMAGGAADGAGRATEDALLSSLDVRSGQALLGGFQAGESDAGEADDVLRLMFIACHPVLSTDTRVALTLRLLGGLTTEEIARAFLIGEPTVAQRIVRAKRTLSAARAPFEVPHGADLTARLPSVLEVVYLIFNEGYSATAGDDWMRPDLCEEAMRLGRMLASLLPDHTEVHGLVALMELQASRLRARTGADGEPILLMDQDRARWDQLLIRRGLAALGRAEAAPSGLGPYALQAAIAACHARARAPEATDWPRIVALYDALAQLRPSPVVELNRAVAVSMAFGPAAGLELVDRLTDEPTLAAYHLLPAVRGDLLAKLGRSPEARVEFERAAALAKNARERDLMLARAKMCAATESPQ